MKSIFDQLTEFDLKIMAERDKLIDRQSGLKVHHYRTKNTALTDADKEYDTLQVQIDDLNKKLLTRN